MSDIDLIREYATQNSEAAFSELVQRHINFIHSIAYRFTNNAQDAQDVTQAVFVVLSKKAGQLRGGTIITPWLYETTRLAALAFLRNKVRREIRENEAYMQNSLNDSNSESVWRRLMPHLEDAMMRLSEKDRAIVVLRFFDNRSLAETAELLGIQEWAARKRAQRVVEKLRLFFMKRGIVVPASTMTSAISVNAVQAAPVGLAKAVTVVALAKGATASASTLSLAQGALKAMAWANLKTTVVLAATILLMAGTTATLIVQRQPPVEAPIDLPKSSWVFAGYGSPEATIQTVEWAINRLDGKTILDGLSSDCQEDFREYLAQNKPGMSVDEFILHAMATQQSDVSGIRIVKTELLSKNQVLMELSYQGKSNLKNNWFKIKKFGDDWKIDDFDPKGSNGRTGLEHLWTQYGGIGVSQEMDPATHEPRIAKVLPGLALSQTNLVPGLILQKINGTSLAGKSLSECVYLTRGRVGTTVVLELFNPEVRKTNILEQSRQRFSKADMIALGWKK